MPDNSNLLSALDLIPDDMLTELLKEDRGNLWSEAIIPHSTSVTNASVTFPYELTNGVDGIETTSSYVLPNLLYSARTNSEFCTDSELYDTSTGSFEWIDLSNHDGSLNHPTSVSSECISTSLGFVSNWISSNSTWSPKPANDQISDSLFSTSSDGCNHNNNKQNGHVLSNLASALILPDFEKRIKTSNASSSSSCLSPNRMTSMLANNYSKNLQTPLLANNFTCSKSSNCFYSGKRRRNASESPPLTVHQSAILSDSKSIQSNKYYERFMCSSQNVTSGFVTSSSLCSTDQSQSCRSSTTSCDGIRTTSSVLSVVDSNWVGGDYSWKDLSGGGDSVELVSG